MSHDAPRIVVTGGAGFIGSHLIDRLMAKPGGDVVAFDNFSRGRLDNLAQLRNEPRFSLIEGDVRDPSAVLDVCKGADVIFHLAAQSTVLGAMLDPEYAFQTNAVGTFNVLRAAVKCSVGRVVFASSCEVYGEPIALPADEDSPLLPINSLGASKVVGEVYCRAFRREFGLSTAILRFSNVYGPRDVGRLIPQWIRQARAGLEFQIFGGKQVLDLIGVDQAVDAMVQAAAIDGPVPPINVGSGTGTRIVDIARRIARLAEYQPKFQYLPARPMEVTRLVANVERMRQILFIEPPLDPLSHLAALVPSPAGALP
jgi:UDP-glucose 4-epimerase